MLREVRDVQRDIILVDPDRPEKFSLQGRTVFAKPDLIYAPGDRPEGAWTVLDWKTTNSENGGELDQVAVYALYAILGRKLTFVDGGCDARIVNLARGTIETLPLDSDLLADTIERLRAEMEAMRRAEIDLETGRVRPLDPALYPQTRAPVEVPVLQLSGALRARGKRKPDSSASAGSPYGLSAAAHRFADSRRAVRPAGSGTAATPPARP